MSNLVPDAPDDEATKDVIVRLAVAGPFTRDDAERALTSAGMVHDVDRVLAALVSRQTVVRLGGEPARWELVID